MLNSSAAKARDSLGFRYPVHFGSGATYTPYVPVEVFRRIRPSIRNRRSRRHLRNQIQCLMANDIAVIDRFLDIFSRYIDSGFGLISGDVGFLVKILIGIDVVLAALAGLPAKTR